MSDVIERINELPDDRLVHITRDDGTETWIMCTTGDLKAVTDRLHAAEAKLEIAMRVVDFYATLDGVDDESGPSVAQAAKAEIEGGGQDGK